MEIYRKLVKQTSRLYKSNPGLKAYFISFYKLNIIKHQKNQQPKLQQLANRMISILGKIQEAKINNQIKIMQRKEMHLSFIKTQCAQLGIQLDQIEGQVFRIFNYIQFYYLVGSKKIFGKKVIGNWNEVISELTYKISVDDQLSLLVPTSTPNSKLSIF